ncbi:sugar transferase [Mucilaginibacter sp. L3T2-6]|uniref:sugar transferase n=1 Tax=Mucilaginibacter sp. L3T2-6 TaxID=3062491 RepID=UPI0026775DE6|nr:sugar transferase [Mucilaginibacter sp. L3T2-6]MDO3642467.1 sugar transferase [Mucilaginibacter sp. L3T2-6]MDV6215137.1 sugar transferase [Mucilaginibacter sp. L3T2-6]
MELIEEPVIQNYSRNLDNNKTSFFEFEIGFNKVEVFCPEEEHDRIRSLLQSITKAKSSKLKKMFSSNKKIILYHHTHQINYLDKLHLVNYIENGFIAYSIVDFLEEINGFTEISLLDWDYFIGKEDFSVLRNTRKVALKRIADYFHAVILIILTLPVSIITAILIKLESAGPIFYLQTRVGQFNEEFKVIKFRSMRQDAESKGAQWAQKNDPRMTRIGEFIRKTRIDEIPQLINVLKGEMSLIGPRPERKVFIDMLVNEIPFYEFRHSVRPGITGLAQVKYPYGASVEDGVWKHKYDLYYIRNQTSFLDLKIILLTIKTVLGGFGR